MYAMKKYFNLMLLLIATANVGFAQIRISDFNDFEYKQQKDLIHLCDSFADHVLVSYLSHYNVQISCADDCSKAWFIVYLDFDQSSKIVSLLITEYHFCEAPLTRELEEQCLAFFAGREYDPAFAGNRVKIRIGRFLKC